MKNAATPQSVCAHLLSQLGFAAPAPSEGPLFQLRDGGATVTIGIDGGPQSGAWDTVSAFLVGAHAAVAGLGWLRWARLNRESIEVSVSAPAVNLACLGERLPQAICERWPTTRRAGRGPILAWCADGWVSCTALTAEQSDDFSRLPGGHALGAWATGRTREDLVAEAQLWRLPILPVLSRAEAKRGAPVAPFRFTRAGRPAGRPPQTGSQPPLGDIRVVDLGAMWAGPYATRLLGQLGARVTRVEHPHRPDGTRPRSTLDCSGVYADLNADKRSVALDLSTPDGLGQLERLLSNADGLVENFSPRVMPNFGLDYHALQAINMGHITVSMPAFACDGACSSFVGYGSRLELAAGLGEIDAGGEPDAAPVPFVDYLAGCYGAIAFLAGLLQRDPSGYGCRVEVPQYEVARQLLTAAWLARTADQWQATAWLPYAPAGYVRSERQPLSGHLCGPAWRLAP